MRFALLALALFFALAAPSSPQVGALHNALRLMRRASGPLWRSHLDEIADLYAGATVQRVHIEQQGERFMLHRCLDDLCLGRFYDGADAADMTINATPLPLDFLGKLARDGNALRLALSLAFLRSDFRAAGGQIALLAPARPDELSLAVRAPNCSEMRLTFDRDGHLLAARIGKAEYRFIDDRRLGDLTLAWRILRNGSPYLVYQQRTVIATPLLRPHPLALDFTSSPVLLPYQRGAHIPVVRCEMAGIPLRCMVDSGTSVLAISVGLTERLHLNALTTFEVQGIGQYLTEVVEAPALSLGSASLPSARYVVLPDLQGSHYDIVLGTDFLASARVEIDGPARVLRLLPSTHRRLADGVPIAFEDLIPTISAHLNGLPARLLLDTGDESVINLSGSFARAHRDLFHAKLSRIVRGVGGSSIERIGVLAKFSVAGHTFTNLSIGSTARLESTTDGHIGSGLLDRFNIIFDYEHARIALRTP